MTPLPCACCGEKPVVDHAYVGVVVHCPSAEDDSEDYTWAMTSDDAIELWNEKQEEASCPGTP